MNYAIQQRLRMIDFLLCHYGAINRSMLMDYYGISSPQASRDFRDYMHMAPGNMAYDTHAKTYLRSPTYTRVYP